MASTWAIWICRCGGFVPCAREKKRLHVNGKDSRMVRAVGSPKETPPRTWRRLRSIQQGHLRLGNTSTHVEKTIQSVRRMVLERKHLHARGEDALATPIQDQAPETPPRTWRRLPPAPQRGSAVGNTSTHVEKTGFSSDRFGRFWKHLHARGEDRLPAPSLARARETPPRTWRRRAYMRRRNLSLRNTSTHVEKTRLFQRIPPNHKKHLHARGEDTTCSRSSFSGLETPPRTWRRPLDGLRCRVPPGNTSTHVEKTIGRSSLFLKPWKHLHARGEDPNVSRTT